MRQLLAGPPLRARDLTQEQITPVEGLPALSLDALHLVLPITVAIVVLLAILVFSYRQVIDAYPGGGGAYAVSRANLGAGASCWRPPRWSSTTRSRCRSRSQPGSRR